ncbi:IS66 family transposase, partial [Rhizobium sp. rho-13.1]
HLAEFTGILQADCYNGFNPLFDRTKKQIPVTPAFCFAHARRKFFELADVSRSARRGKGAKPVSATALEAVKRIDALFD